MTRKNGKPKRSATATPRAASNATIVIRDRIVDFRRVKASTLVPNDRNWRTHPESQRAALRGVLAEVGYVDALLARQLSDGRLELIDGHLRAEETPDTEVPVLVVDLDDEEAAKVLATFDPLSAMAEANAAKLEALLAGVKTDDAALAELLSQTADNAGLGEKQEVTEDEAPEPPKVPVTKPGDLWLLGEHRLLCGDSTKAENMARVMRGERAVCIFTDPPYGVSVAKKNATLNANPSPNGGSTGGGRNTTDIIDDDLTPDKLEQSLLQAFVNIRTAAMAEDCSLFVCSPQGCGLSMMMMMMQKAGLKARHVLIWVKNQPTFSMGRLDYDYQHEPILLTWLKRHKRPMRGTHKTSVWKVDKPRKSQQHPTMKPVELYANAYLNNSDDGDTVFDAYSGSGTGFIAAEQLGRRCFGLEIAPAYCDVIVQRWENLTGKKAKREKKSGGKTR